MYLGTGEAALDDAASSVDNLQGFFPGDMSLLAPPPSHFRFICKNIRMLTVGGCKIYYVLLLRAAST